MGKLLPDLLEGVQHTRLADDILSVSFKTLCRALKSQAFYLDKQMDVPEGLHILLRKQAISLCISLWTDELREFISPEAYKRGALSQDFGNFAYCVKIFFHINPLTAR